MYSTYWQRTASTRTGVCPVGTAGSRMTRVMRPRTRTAVASYFVGTADHLATVGSWQAVSIMYGSPV